MPFRCRPGASGMFGTRAGWWHRVPFAAGCSLVLAGSPVLTWNTGRHQAAPDTAATTRDGLDAARKLLAAGDAAGAAALLRTHVASRPTDAAAHLLLGKALALVHEPTEALAALRRAIVLRPDLPDAHYTLGAALARFGDPAGAIPALERALALNPRLAEAHVSLGLVLAQRGMTERAALHFRSALDLLGESAPAARPHYLLAQLLRESGDRDAALTHLAAAIARQPGYFEAYLSQGALRRELGDEAGAMESFQTAARLSPDHPTAAAELGAAYLRAGQAALAIPHLERAVAGLPEDRTARYQLCRALQATGRREEAKACSTALAKRLARNAAGADLTAGQANNDGVALEAAGQLAAALERYRAAVAASPSNIVFRRNLALALCRLDRWTEAIAELEVVLAVSPGDPDATRALSIARERAAARTQP